MGNNVSDTATIDVTHGCANSSLWTSFISTDPNSEFLSKSRNVALGLKTSLKKKAKRHRNSSDFVKSESCNGGASSKQVLAADNKQREPYLLRELAIGHRLAAKLDVDGVGAGGLRRVDDADGAVAVVDDRDVDVGVAAAADAARHVAVAGLRRVHVDHALLPDRDRSPDPI